LSKARGTKPRGAKKTLPSPSKTAKSNPPPRRPPSRRPHASIIKIALAVIAANGTIAATLAGGPVDGAINVVAEWQHMSKPFLLEHESFGQALVLMAIITITGFLFAYIETRQ
jgi:hypothetical protein